MAMLLNRLPFFDEETSVEMPEGRVIVRAFQIVCWVSLTPPGITRLPVNSPRFPAVLDTGCNHNLVLREEHLNRWAGLELTALWYGSIRVNQEPVPLLKAKLWLHPNKVG